MLHHDDDESNLYASSSSNHNHHHPPGPYAVFRAFSTDQSLPNLPSSPSLFRSTLSPKKRSKDLSTDTLKVGAPWLTYYPSSADDSSGQQFKKIADNILSDSSFSYEEPIAICADESASIIDYSSVYDDDLGSRDILDATLTAAAAAAATSQQTMHLDQNQVPHLLPSTNSLLPSSNTHSKDYTNAISEDEIIRYSLTTSSSSSSSSSLFFDTPEVQQQPQTSSSFSFTGVSFPYASTSNSPISTDPRRGSIGRHYANDSEPRVVDHNESAPFPSPIPSLPTVTSGDDTPTNSSITFYQGFRAIYPKFAKGFELTGLFKLSSISSTSQTPSTSTAASKGERRATSGLQLDRSLMIHSSTTTRKVGGGGNSFENSSSSLLSLSTSSVVGLGLAKHFASFGKKQSSEYLSVQTTTTTTTMATAANSTASANSASSGLSARSHSVAIANIARLFSELLSERDSALHESERLGQERCAVTSELIQVEELLNEMKQKKRFLQLQLKGVVEKETKANSTLELLETRIDSIGQESRSFEKQIRSIKADSAVRLADLNEDQDDEVESASCIKTLFGHSGSIEALSIDHPFGLLATGSADHTARIWDLSTNRCKAELRGHSGWVRSVAINGTNVFSGSNDHLIRMWDLTRIPPSSVTSSSSSSSKSRLLTPPILPGAPEFIAYAETTKKTGKSLWSFSSSTSSAHDADEGETVCSQKYIGHSGGVTCMWVDRGAMCSGSADKTVRQWDIETGKCVSVLRSKRWVDREENLDQVDSILYGGASPTTSSSQKLARDSSTGKLEGFLPGEDPGHWRSERDTSKRRNFVFDEFVVNGGGNNDDSNQQGFMLYNIGGQVNAIQFRQYALAAGYGDGIVRLWDMRTSESNRHLGGDAGHQSLNRRHSSSLDNTRHGDSITCLLFDDFNIVTGSVDKTVKVWDLRTGMVVDTLNFDSGVTSLAFDNRRIVIAAGAKEVKMYNRSTGTFSALGEEVDGGWSGHGKAVRSVQLIGGERVVSGGMDGLVKFWNI